MILELWLRDFVPQMVGAIKLLGLQIMMVSMLQPGESIPLMKKNRLLKKLLKGKLPSLKLQQKKKLPKKRLQRKRRLPKKGLQLGNNSTARLTSFKTTIASN